MNDDIKAEWVAALRSGDYVQGNGRLRFYDGRKDQESYCCLGVLCVLAQAAGVIGPPTKSTITASDDNEDIVYVYKNLDGTRGFIGHLPADVAEWAEIRDPVVDIHFDELTDEERAELRSPIVRTTVGLYGAGLATLNDAG